MTSLDAVTDNLGQARQFTECGWTSPRKADISSNAATMP
jgi:hypothetical protein